MTRSEEGERTRGKANEREREIKRGSTRERDDSSVTEERRRSEAERERERGRRRRNHGDDYDEEDASKRRRSMSPSDRYSRHNKPKPRSHSPDPELRPRPRSRPRHHDEVSASRGDDHGSDVDDSISKMQAAEEALQAKQKEKPSFELSGKLAAETNRVRGVTLLFNEPPDAAKPNIRWRLYVFKNGESLNEPLYIHRQSCYLFGRERRVADIPTDHPSCSKQHAVIQFRKVEKEKHDGMLSKQVRPYLMDLGSTNKTFINDSSIEPQRYYELHEQDTIKFGNSSREYVLLHENSAT